MGYIHHDTAGRLPGEALGQAESFLDFQEQLSRVAPVERPVLLLGERGTGKELAASRLHYLSRRWDQPLVTLNCATLSPTLIEAELFGHERGAFTGAESRRRGRFEAADGGTLFLDEIGLIPMIAQEKILRVVEYGSFERVGGTDPVEVDVRIVAATNADLSAMAERGEFKRDLLDRLSFEVLFLPPLRRRREDILLLAEHFASKMAFELEREEFPRFSSNACDALLKHDWQGNIRELKNVVERAVYRATGPVIDNVVFNPFVSPFSGDALEGAQRSQAAQTGQTDSSARSAISACAAGDKLGAETTAEPSAQETVLPGTRSGTSGEIDLRGQMVDYEKQLIANALRDCRFHQRRAAERLGLTYDQLRNRLRKYPELLATL